jgi:hypothetical protein
MNAERKASLLRFQAFSKSHASLLDGRPMDAARAESMTAFAKEILELVSSESSDDSLELYAHFTSRIIESVKIPVPLVSHPVYNEVRGRFSSLQTAYATLRSSSNDEWVVLGETDNGVRRVEQLPNPNAAANPELHSSFLHSLASMAWNLFRGSGAIIPPSLASETTNPAQEPPSPHELMCQRIAPSLADCQRVALAFTLSPELCKTAEALLKTSVFFAYLTYHTRGGVEPSEIPILSHLVADAMELGLSLSHPDAQGQPTENTSVSPESAPTRSKDADSALLELDDIFPTNWLLSSVGKIIILLSRKYAVTQHSKSGPYIAFGKVLSLSRQRLLRRLSEIGPGSAAAAELMGLPSPGSSTVSV